MTRAAPTPLGNILWSTLALLFLAWSVAGMFGIATKRVSQPSLVEIAGLFAGLALYGVVGFWLVGGAWLRTTWGRRFIARRHGTGRSRGSADGQQGI